MANAIGTVNAPMMVTSTRIGSPTTTAKGHATQETARNPGSSRSQRICLLTLSTVRRL